MKLFPPVVTLIFGALMYLLNHILPSGAFDFFGRELMTYIVLAIGGLIFAISVFQFIKAKTTTNPIKLEQVSTLVTGGIYNYTRNPMYLAMLLFLIALGLYLGNAFNTLVAAGFVYYMNHFQINEEEKALTEKFGKTYKLYCKAVRRWF